MIGVPPFMDDTPEAVFDNILNMEPEFPEGDESLSDGAMAAIRSLLDKDPKKRSGFAQIRNGDLELFRDVDWANLLEQDAPFMPQPDDEMDTGYFDARNNMLNLKVSQVEQF